MKAQRPKGTDYRTFTHEQLIDLLTKRDQQVEELKRGRLGLVWERSELEPEHAVNDDFVALDFQAELSCGRGTYDNLLIEGDNFDALRALRVSHAGRIKCIYIDPPYNTGNKDFIYNDRFIDKEHRYRHSLWLDFMYKRLLLARELLAEDGVIFISIGEDEHARLELLMEEIMPRRKVGTFIVKVRSGSNDKGNQLSTDHEYVVCYANPGFSLQGLPKVLKGYANPDGDPRGNWTSGDLLKGSSIYDRPNTFYPIHNPATDIWYPASPESVWRFSTEKSPPKKKVDWTIESLIADSRIDWKEEESEPLVYPDEATLRAAIESGEAPADLRITLERDELQAKVDAGELKQSVVDAIPPLSFWVGKRIGRKRPRYKRFESELRSSEKPLSSLIFKANAPEEKETRAELAEFSEFIDAGTTTDGTRLLRQMLPGVRFPYPKPLELIKGLIQQATQNDPEALVLDFFAGSGTTGHAVLQLNEEEGTRRKFILVSNREANSEEPSRNICKDITAARLVKAIKGYRYAAKGKGGFKAVEGLGGNFAYLRVNRIPFSDVHVDLQQEQTWTALLLMNDMVVKLPSKGLHIAEDETRRIVHIKSDTDCDEIEAVKKAVSKSKKPTVIYSRRPQVTEDAIGRSPTRTFSQVPEEILKRFWRGM